jgi:predicted transglutaminase-like protease
MAITELRKAVKVVCMNRFVILAWGLWNTVIFPWKCTSGAGTYMSKSHFHVHLRDTVQISYECRYILYILDMSGGRQDEIEGGRLKFMAL